MNKPLILVVEDDKPVRNLITTTLKTHDYKYVFAENGAGAVMEALSSEKYSSVAPAYFEIALKVKYAHDNESAVMYDLIRNAMFFDFGYTYNTAIGYPKSTFTACIQKEDSIASTVASKGPALQAKLDEYIAQVREGNRH